MAVPNQDTSKSKASGKPAEDKPARVAFEMAPALAAEVNRIISISDLKRPPEVFRRAFTLLRIHVDAALRGQQIVQVDPANPSERYLITLPFVVNREAGEHSRHGRE